MGGGDCIDFCNCSKSFIRSMGATAVLARAPAAAPDMASIRDVFTLSLFDSFGVTLNAAVGDLLEECRSMMDGWMDE